MDDAIDQLNTLLEGRFVVLRPLGTGGTATVYLADDLRHSRRVALKVLRPNVAAAIGPTRFLAEIRVTAGLNHPAITPVYDSGQAGPFLYFVMPVVEDQTLRDRLDADGPVAVEEAIDLIADLASGLDYAHEHNVVHRDLKPENVLLHRGHALLTDFGIAGMVESAGGPKLTDAGVTLGTPHYMSPEQITDADAVGPRSDVYALAVVCYEMLTGRPPFDAGTVPSLLARILVESPPPLRPQRPDVSATVEAAVTRALSKAPVDRFASAGEFADALASGRLTRAGVRSPIRRWVKRAVAVFGAILVLGGAALYFWIRGEATRWARNEAIPQLAQLVEDEQWDSAWLLARQVQQRAPHVPELAPLMNLVTAPVTITSDPPGAEVWRRDYNGQPDSWERLGVTPLADHPFPRGASVIRMQLADYQPALVAVIDARVRHVVLDPAASDTNGMVRVDASAGSGDAPQLDAFHLDQFEVTNDDYRRFVEAGGYGDARYWRHPFTDAGRRLTFEAAMLRFVDQTGRAGPATWIGGVPERDTGHHPVGGLSWFEAAAYAEFAGKSLPSSRHWLRALGLRDSRLSAYLLPASNLRGARAALTADAGPAPVGQFAGVGPFGTFDMAGNHREWVFNASGSERLILGGSWSDNDHIALIPFAALSPWDRNAANGLRLAQFSQADPTLAGALAPVPRMAGEDLARTSPIATDVLAAYRELYDYDRAPLDARLDQRESAPQWDRERISINAAYGNERIVVYLFLPRAPRLTGDPRQVVVFWPGVSAAALDSLESWSTSEFDFILESGRAVALPVLKGMFERRAPLDVRDARTIEWRDRVIAQVQDVRRTLDYLESRPDLDATRPVYYGHSWGAAMAPLVLAIEHRFVGGVLYLPGLIPGRLRSEVNPITFIHHVRIPVIALSGRIDPVFAFDVHAQPFVSMLGTPRAAKRHVVTWSGHWVPRATLVREVLDWLDRQLGPVKPD